MATEDPPWSPKSHVDGFKSKDEGIVEIDALISKKYHKEYAFVFKSIHVEFSLDRVDLMYKSGTQGLNI